MRCVRLFILLMLPLFAAAQARKPLLRYKDTTSGRYGYKDRHGTIKLPAQFTLFCADTLHHIVAVSDSNYKSYYLLRDGRKAGRDSVYMFDFEFDCEQEGKIRFYDRIGDRVGFFDTNARVVIPAAYNTATPFHNGMALVLRDAHRKCFDDDCEHRGWEGGTVDLIDAHNKVLIAGWKNDTDVVNWYSMRQHEENIDTPVSISVRGVNGAIYSFVCYNREFERWFYNAFVPAAGNSKALKELLFPVLTTRIGEANRGWKEMTAGAFITKNSRDLENILATCTKNNTTIALEHSIFFKSDHFLRYRNSCGAHNMARFPLFSVTRSYYRENGELQYQDNFDFIKTETGYKLYGITLR